jgi:hypothetical protein
LVAIRVNEGGPVDQKDGGTFMPGVFTRNLVKIVSFGWLSVKSIGGERLPVCPIMELHHNRAA